MATRVFSTGTVAVAADKRTVTLSGGAWTSLNAAPSSLIVISGNFNFVNSLTDTTHLVLQLDYTGSVPASGLAYAIYPLTANEVSTATANARLAALLARLALSPQGIPLYMDGSGTTDQDPGAGFARFNSATNPTWAYISKTNNLGNDISARLGMLDDSINAVSRAVLDFFTSDGSNAYLDFDVTGAIVDGGTYVKVPVVLRSGTVPADGAALAMTGVPSGKDGANGASSGIGYTFSTATTASDPGSGKFQFNNATIASATALYIDNLEASAGADVTAWLDSWDDSTATIHGKLFVSVASDPSKFHVFNVTGTVVDSTGYRTVTVAHVSGTAAISNSASCIINFAATGNNGTNGTNGSNGTAAGVPLAFDTTTTDSDPGGPGKIRANNATFGSITFLYIDGTDTGSSSVASWIGLLGSTSNASARSILHFTTSAGAEQMSFKVTGAVVDGGSGTYWKIPVTGLAGALPANTTALRLTYGVSGADGTGAVTSVNAQTGAVLLKSSEQAENLGLAFSVAASALTCAAKQADGASDPTSSAPAYVGMRSATLTSGAFSQRSITGALSLVVPSGATLGHSSGVAGSLYWYLIDNAGTLELAVSATDQGRAGILSSTTISSGATSATTIYSTTGRSNVPFRKIAQTIDTQTTAGAWAAAPSTVQLSPTADDTRLLKSANLSDLANAATAFGNIKQTATTSASGVVQKGVDVREILTANRTYFVAASGGSDSNTGLTSGVPFATIQHALDIAGTLDFNGFTVTVQLADGTYTAGGLVPVTVGQSSTASFVIQGNATTPANVLVSVTSNNCFGTSTGGRVLVKDMKLQTTTGGYCFQAHGVGSELDWSNINFGACAVSHVLADGGGVASCAGNYAISGGAVHHIEVDRGTIEVGSKTITITGTPAFSSSFANASQGNMRTYSNTYSGSATGVRYTAAMNGTIQTFGAGASALPGSSAGTTATGGQYA